MASLRTVAAYLMIALAFGGASPLLPTSAGAQPAPSVSREFLIGRWTDTNDCSNAVDFFADGTFATTDGVRGRWVLEGERLSFIGQTTVRGRVQATGRDSLTITRENGAVGSSTRCGATAATRLTMPPLPPTIAEALRISRPATATDLIGRWTDDGDCNNTITFRSDGTFLSPGANGRWTLSGDQLTFIGNSTVNARARAVGQNRIVLIHPDGSIGQSVRC